MLAAADVPSKVGAVTVETRYSGNKSGVSHIVDWAMAIGVLDKNLNPGAEGHVLHLMWREEVLRNRTNPYVVLGQRLAFGWLLFQADGDMLRAILAELPANSVVDKAGALRVFEKAFRVIYDEAYGARSEASAAAVRRIREMRDDLAIPFSRDELEVGRSSTLWHRLSSRLESLVDLGLLEKKDANGAPRPFDYVYKMSNAGERAVATLTPDIGVEQWLLEHLAGTIGGAVTPVAKCSNVGHYLGRAVKSLAGPTGVHIDTCSLLAASFALEDGLCAEIAEFRTQLVNTALVRPDLARLARGYSGPRPEFITFDQRALDGNVEGLFDVVH
jgi:hypothetical protein